MAIATFETTLTRKVQETPDAWRFYFKRPKGFEYRAGQYIKMYLDVKDPDDRGVTRYFTLSSSPTEDELLVTTRILKSTFKLKLGKLDIGTKVKMRGLWGDFFIHKDNTKPLVFLSGGIGITPFRSMLRFASDTKLATQITMFASYKTPDEIFFNKELTEISALNSNIQIINTITQPEETFWKGETGRIDEAMLKRHLDNLSKYIYYIAGPDPLVDAMEKMLKGLKIPAAQILTDGFPGY